MVRSIWKVPYISPYFIFRRNKILKLKQFNTWLRNSIITGFFINKRIRVYNGNKSISFIVYSSMLGHRLGEFSITKILGSNILKSKAKKLKDKKKSKSKKKGK